MPRRCVRWDQATHLVEAPRSTRTAARSTTSRCDHRAVPTFQPRRGASAFAGFLQRSSRTGPSCLPDFGADLCSASGTQPFRCGRSQTAARRTQGNCGTCGLHPKDTADARCPRAPSGAGSPREEASVPRVRHQGHAGPGLRVGSAGTDREGRRDHLAPFAGLIPLSPKLRASPPEQGSTTWS